MQETGLKKKKKSANETKHKVCTADCGVIKPLNQSKGTLHYCNIWERRAELENTGAQQICGNVEKL